MHPGRHVFAYELNPPRPQRFTKLDEVLAACIICLLAQDMLEHSNDEQVITVLDAYL
jgi:hypothetical protein